MKRNANVIEEQIDTESGGSADDGHYNPYQPLLHPYYRRPPFPFHPSIVEPDERDYLLARRFWMIEAEEKQRHKRFDTPGDWRVSEADLIECLDHALKS